jgi:hypothetical protein
MFYANFKLLGLQGPMIDRSHDIRRTSPAAALLLAAGLCAGLCLILGGCADMGDSFVSGAFVDPAKYDNFDCKQLDVERKSLATRTAELQGLMAKAETGTGGTVVVELAYRNDYISARGQAKLAEEVWQRNKCAATTPAATTPAAPPAPAAPAHTKGHGASRSGTSGLY